VFNTQNRITGASYDAAGNQVVVNGDTAVYDAENRQVSLTEPPSLGGGTENYWYDGLGQRVEKSGPGGTTMYVYDALQRLVAEYGTNGPTSPCTTCYLAWDHLGTVRLVTDQNADVIARHDYLPFGEEIGAGIAARNGLWGPQRDTISPKFTGKERDQESGLDFFQARYYGSALGRFTSPDAPLVDQFEENPQSWNLYSYVRNNPLRNVDPTGNACVYSGSGDLNDSSNYSDDNSGGQSCSDAFSPQQNSQPSATVYGQGGNQLEAFGLNLGFAFSNIANSYFSFIAPNSQLLSQTPTNREFTGQLATGVAIAGTALIGPEGEAAQTPRAIKVSWGRLLHVLALHTGGVANKSFFGDAAEIASLIKAAESVTAVPSVGGRFVRTLDAGRTVGTDITTGQPTSVYTVVTDSNGELVTAFPGSPRR
jgi:RHS repeat-associated protein